MEGPRVPRLVRFVSGGYNPTGHHQITHGRSFVAGYAASKRVCERDAGGLLLLPLIAAALVAIIFAVHRQPFR